MTRDVEGVKDQGWMIVDPGSKVVTADGKDFGTVREKTPHYLTVRGHKNVLEEVETYVPRDFIDHVEDGTVVLVHTAGALSDMDLTKPPAIRAEAG